MFLRMGCVAKVWHEAWGQHRGHRECTPPQRSGGTNAELRTGSVASTHWGVAERGGGDMVHLG